MSENNMDFLGQGKSQGEVAGYFMNNSRLDVGGMRPYIDKNGKPRIAVYNGGDPKKKASYSSMPITNATLRRDEWKSLDDAVMRISESRLRGIQDLVNNNLTFNLGNAMGTTVLESHEVSDALSAELSMDGVQRGQNDRPEYTSTYLPIPIIHAGYEINRRALSASRSLGNGLDTTMAERASRKVSEKLEQLLFTSTSYKFGNGTIYSYLNHPDRNQVTLGTNWDASGKTPTGIKDDVIALKQASINSYHYGPWMLYVPTNYETLLDDDYNVSGSSTQTIRQRIQAIDGIQGIKVIDTLPDDNVLLVQMTSDVVRLVRGMGIQNVEWSQEGNFVTKYKVMTIQVPQIRSDHDGNTGIVHLAA